MYNKHFSRKQTPQSEPLPGQVPNSAGGHAFEVDDWKKLRRFLILGSEGGTYYIDERKLTRASAKAIDRCWVQDPVRTVNEIVEVSDKGLAKKNDPALFALALGASAEAHEARALALAALPKVARIGTHLYHFADYVQSMRGWGRGLRRAIARWYEEMPVDRLALQVVKYRQRDGWSHRDLLWKAHAKTSDPVKSAVYDHLFGLSPSPDRLPPLMQGYLEMQEASDPGLAAELIARHKLPWEAVPDAMINDPVVLKALLQDMGITALIRQLGRLSKADVLKPLSDTTRDVCARLRDVDELRKGRVHPLQVLLAQAAYREKPDAVADVVEALEDAFTLAFQTVEPAGKRFLIGLDVSGSMSTPLARSPISCREAAAAMALITYRTEPSCHVTAFASGGWSASGGQRSYWTRGLVPFNITRRDSLSSVVERTKSLSFSGTDCSLPMLYAIDKGLEVDGFVVYTDSETWAGDVHPTEALKMYRQKSGIDAKLVVVGMVANDFSIADPSDPGMLDVVGFDASAPRVISEFVGGGGF